MEIETLVVGYLQENCYIITKDDKSIIIDPGDEYEKILEACKNKNIIGILITHHHFDHIGALKKLEQTLGIKETKSIDGFDYEVIETKGHTEDSLTYYFPNELVMFTGDFLFKGTIGRMDLPGGSKKDMINSLDKIKKYPASTKIYPGHGPSTTLENEMPYFNLYLS